MIERERVTMDMIISTLEQICENKQHQIVFRYDIILCFGCRGISDTNAERGREGE